jgi:hypothetical protein
LPKNQLELLAAERDPLAQLVFASSCPMGRAEVLLLIDVAAICYDPGGRACPSE